MLAFKEISSTLYLQEYTDANEIDDLLYNTYTGTRHQLLQNDRIYITNILLKNDNLMILSLGIVNYWFLLEKLTHTLNHETANELHIRHGLAKDEYYLDYNEHNKNTLYLIVDILFNRHDMSYKLITYPYDKIILNESFTAVCRKKFIDLLFKDL